MSADPFSNLIKATRLYFPQGHPMRRVADVVSKMDFLGKYQNLQQTRAQLLYQLEEIAYWKRIYPNINYLKYQEKIEGQLAECDKQINQLNEVIQSDEAMVSVMDKLRFGSR